MVVQAVEADRLVQLIMQAELEQLGKVIMVVLEALMVLVSEMVGVEVEPAQRALVPLTAYQAPAELEYQAVFQELLPFTEVVEVEVATQWPGAQVVRVAVVQEAIILVLLRELQELPIQAAVAEVEATATQAAGPAEDLA
jgi:hypothetical protein